ncbi:uncharacterized protein LOC131034125 [Cryptomeria japonica]|uniref:uncharacterized protein LOC131034125 n=1 Tax=Cryptomeria japonica TaxID=3369 RepID=UPI0025ABEDA9|nr:uncharacterized protein LOC131034125 [Cryptomeria japonica]
MVDIEDKDNKDKDVNSEREENKEPEQDITKDRLSEDKESVEPGKNRKQTDKKRKDYDRDQIKWKQDMEEKVLDNSSSPKLVVDLDMDEETIEIGSGEATPGGAANRTRASVKKAVTAFAKDSPDLRENIKDLYGISNTLANAISISFFSRVWLAFVGFLGL